MLNPGHEPTGCFFYKCRPAESYNSPVTTSCHERLQVSIDWLTNTFIWRRRHIEDGWRLWNRLHCEPLMACSRLNTATAGAQSCDPMAFREVGLYFPEGYTGHISIVIRCTGVIMGRDLGGRSPKKFEVGVAHASVPPIFGEVMLSDSWQSTNWLKKVSWRNVLFWNRGFSARKGSYMSHNIRLIYSRDRQKTDKNTVDD